MPAMLQSNSFQRWKLDANQSHLPEFGKALKFAARGQNASCSLCDDLLAVETHGPIECGTTIIVDGRLFLALVRTLTAFDVV